MVTYDLLPNNSKINIDNLTSWPHELTCDWNPQNPINTVNINLNLPCVDLWTPSLRHPGLHVPEGSARRGRGSSKVPGPLWLPVLLRLHQRQDSTTERLQVWSSVQLQHLGVWCANGGAGLVSVSVWVSECVSMCVCECVSECVAPGWPRLR